MKSETVHCFCFSSLSLTVTIPETGSFIKTEADFDSQFGRPKRIRLVSVQFLANTLDLQGR